MYRFAVYTLTLTLALAFPAMAEVYRYRTPEGRWMITNTPPPAGTESETYVEADDITTHAAPFAAEHAASESVTPPSGISERTSDALEFGKSTDYTRGNYWYVQGLVRNTTRKETLRFVRITIKVFDRRGELLVIEDTFTKPTHLGPGQEATYTLMVENRPGIYRYNTSANWGWE